MTQPPPIAALAQIVDTHTELYQNAVYADVPQKHRSGGTFGVSMIDVLQHIPDMVTDAPVPEYFFGLCRTPAKETVNDLGDGPKVIRNHPGDTICIASPDVEFGCRGSCEHRLTFFAIPKGNMLCLEED